MYSYTAQHCVWCIAVTIPSHVTIAGQTVNKDSAAIWTLSANDILDDDIVSYYYTSCGSCDPTGIGNC